MVQNMSVKRIVWEIQNPILVLGLQFGEPLFPSTDKDIVFRKRANYLIDRRMY